LVDVKKTDFLPECSRASCSKTYVLQAKRKSRESHVVDGRKWNAMLHLIVHSKCEESSQQSQEGLQITHREVPNVGALQLNVWPEKFMPLQSYRS
jgi:hypothetical protein